MGAGQHCALLSFFSRHAAPRPLAAGYSVLAVNNLVPVPLKARDANRFGDGLAVVLPHEPDPEPAGAGGRRAAIQGPKRALQPLVSPFRPEQAAETGVRPPRQLSRITLTCDGDRDGGAARLAEALNRPEPGTYDLVAACPASEAALAACLATGRVDIISIDCAARSDLALRPSLVRTRSGAPPRNRPGSPRASGPSRARPFGAPWRPSSEAQSCCGRRHAPLASARPPRSPAPARSPPPQFSQLEAAGAFLELSVGPALRDRSARRHFFALLERAWRCTRGGKRLIVST